MGDGQEVDRLCGRRMCREPALMSPALLADHDDTLASGPGLLGAGCNPHEHMQECRLQKACILVLAATIESRQACANVRLGARHTPRMPPSLPPLPAGCRCYPGRPKHSSC